MEERVAGTKEAEAVFVLNDGRTFAIWISSKRELPIANVFLFF